MFTNFFYWPIPPFRCQQMLDLVFGKPIPYNLGRVPPHHCIGWNIFYDNSASSHYRPSADGYSANNGCIVANPHIALDKGLWHRIIEYLVLSKSLRAGIIVIAVESWIR